jgi:hypothetical protein
MRFDWGAQQWRFVLAQQCSLTGAERPYPLVPRGFLP